jgi:hypothetical protein
LFSICGLNPRIQKKIIAEIGKDFTNTKKRVENGKRDETIHKSMREGIKFCKIILESHGNMFPRNKPYPR